LRMVQKVAGVSLQRTKLWNWRDGALMVALLIFTLLLLFLSS
jgi:hypothetical protein